MSRDDLFEHRVGSFLQAGPVVAPVSVLDAAADHARSHPRRRRWLAWLPGRSVVEDRDPLASTASRWRLAFAAATVVVLVEASLIGLPLLRSVGGPAPIDSSSPEVPTPSIPASPVVPAPVDGAVHVTTSGAPMSYGVSCGGSRCFYDAELVSSDPRLAGCYMLSTSNYGVVGSAAWGSAVISSDPKGCFYPFVPMTDAATWEGVWFTSHGVPAGAGADPAGDDVYPVDTVWLSGKGANVGLTAVLRMPSPGKIDGWIFLTPSR